MRHKAVARCAAFPVADTRLGEKVCLSVIFHDGDERRRRRAARASARRRAVALRHAGIFHRDDAYPLTASGKILKRELVEWAKSGRIKPQPVRWTGS